MHDPQNVNTPKENDTTLDVSSGVLSYSEPEKKYPHSSARLKVRKQFLAVAGGGLKAIASTLVVQGAAVRSPEEGGVKVGFTVTKKTGNSVVRNRIRRRLRAAVAQDIADYGLAGWDYVVIGRNTALEAPFDIIRRDLRYALKKVSKKPIRQQDSEKK